MNWPFAGWKLTSIPKPRFFQRMASPPMLMKTPPRLGVAAHVPPVTMLELLMGEHSVRAALSRPFVLALSCAVPSPSIMSTELWALANGTQSNRRERMGR
jgi:hypothetical protein